MRYIDVICDDGTTADIHIDEPESGTYLGRIVNHTIHGDTLARFTFHWSGGPYVDVYLGDDTVVYGFNVWEYASSTASIHHDARSFAIWLAALSEIGRAHV